MLLQTLNFLSACGIKRLTLLLICLKANLPVKYLLIGLVSKKDNRYLILVIKKCEMRLMKKLWN